MIELCETPVRLGDHSGAGGPRSGREHLMSTNDTRTAVHDLQLGPAHTRGWTLGLSPWGGLALALPLMVMIGVFVILPLVTLVGQTFGDGRGVDRMLAVFTTPASQRALGTTLVDSLIVTLVVTIAAAALAWSLHMATSTWVRVSLWVITLIPMFLGVVVKNYAIFIMLSANGPVNSALIALGFIDQPASLLFTDFAVIVGIAYSLIPYGTLSMYAAINHIKPELIAAGESLGSTRFTALRTIAVPLARRGAIATMSLIFVLSIGFYVTPILLGGPQTAFMATFIAQQINALYDFPGASASALSLILVAVVVVGTVIAFVGGTTFRKALR